MPATRPHRAWLLLAGISLLALVIRLWSLDYYGLWYDEVASIEIASRGPLAIFTDRFGGMLVQTPLHYFLVWLTSQPIDPATSPIGASNGLCRIQRLAINFSPAVTGSPAWAEAGSGRPSRPELRKRIASPVRPFSFRPGVGK
jgi:hypothetical protein